jgi:ABC-type uncharacterized transport system involved in gliding motility auxiliary subunit
MTTQSKRLMSGTGLVVLALLFLALTILSNALFRGYRLDLTENKLYTLADGTQDILGNIEEPLNLYFFFSRRASEEIPQLRTYAQRVRELLQEFEEQSDGGIQLTEIDPLPFSEEEDRAAAFGLQGVTLGGVGADPIYFGLAATNSVGDVETIPFFQPDREAFLEYDLAKLVYTLATPERPVVGILSSLPMTSGFDPATGRPREPWVVASQIEQLFEVRRLEPGMAAIDDDIGILMVVHPKMLDDRTLYAIDQFVMRGGRLIAFVDPMSDAELPSDMAGASAALFADRSSSLDRLFSAWGWEVPTDEIVLDLEYALTVNAGGAGGPVRHLGFLGVTGDGLSRTDVVTADLDRINLASTGHIVLGEDAAVQLTPLVRSSTASGVTPAETLRFWPDPATLLDDFVATGERYNLAARLTGELATAFPEGPPTDEGDADDEAGDARPEHRAASDGPVNVVVVADTDILSDRMWVQVQSFFGQPIYQAFADNGALVNNAIDNMAGSSELISVRSRGTYSRPFERVERLRAEADAAYRATQQELEEALAETERKLSELQTAKDEDNLLIMSEEQQAELLRFQEQRLEIRQQLRDVQHNLDRSIEKLGTRIKFLNIFLVPALILLSAIAVYSMRARRRRES